MTDREIIHGLISRDNRVTEQFFFVNCRPLLLAVMRLVFSRPVEYDEMVSELYAYLMADDAMKLRKFQYRSSIYQWLKVVATRYFIRRRDNMIADISQTPDCLGIDSAHVDTLDAVEDAIDVERLLSEIPNQRYADVIRHLILRDESPEAYAASIGVSIDNLYNIKRRAMASLTRVATQYNSPAYGL